MPHQPPNKNMKKPQHTPKEEKTIKQQKNCGIHRHRFSSTYRK